jgi:hypothetical protein
MKFFLLMKALFRLALMRHDLQNDEVPQSPASQPFLHPRTLPNIEDDEWGALGFNIK